MARHLLPRFKNTRRGFSARDPLPFAALDARCNDLDANIDASKSNEPARHKNRKHESWGSRSPRTSLPPTGGSKHTL